jgi:hypothetical protein
MLANSLLRGVMLESATKADTLSRHLSVKGAMQVVESFTAPTMAVGGNQAICYAFLATVSAHRVGNRPPRLEPRMVKRRPKNHARMMLPRYYYYRKLALTGPTMSQCRHESPEAPISIGFFHGDAYRVRSMANTP